jgi:AraC-like DNA-binding protein
MDPAPDLAPTRISTRDLPSRDRSAVVREVLGRKVLRLEIENLPDQTYHADLNVQPLAGIKIVSGHITGGVARRTRDLRSDGNDDVAVAFSLSGQFVATQRNEACSIRPGDAYFGSTGEDISFLHLRNEMTTLFLSRSELAALVPGLEDKFGRSFRVQSAPVRLLRHYVSAFAQPFSLEPELAASVATHIYDLVALAAGAARDVAEIASCRGLRAARLQAIKTDIAATLTRQSLSVEAIAARHCLTARAVQRLFESEGGTFTAFVIRQRLALAHRRLSDAGFAHHHISTIAYDCGFGDISHFNRLFRRRYGASPSEVRAAAA